MIPDPGQIALAFGLSIVGLTVLTWIAVLIKDLPEGAPSLYKYVSGVMSQILSAAPAQPDVDKSSFAIKAIVKVVIPVVFWLLVIIPMVVFPVILIAMPILHIPWSYLLPPNP